LAFDLNLWSQSGLALELFHDPDLTHSPYGVDTILPVLSTKYP